MANDQKKFVVFVLVAAIFISSFFGAVFGFMAGSIGKMANVPGLRNIFSRSGNSQTVDKATPQILNVTDEESAVTKAVEKASPAVVSVIISKDVPKMQNFFSDPFGADPFFDPFGSGQSQNRNQRNSGGSQKQEIGGGSGFIVTPDGMIVTNRHVISEQGADYTVLTNDGSRYEAKVLAVDPSNDLGILKIEASNLPVIEIGDSAALKIGQTVIAIGNSLGEFRNTVSKGIVSGLKRNVTAGSGLGDSEQLSEVIQTDAAINPGNSGGPLLDISGKVVGVNVAMAQGAENIGFALPVNLAKKDIESVKTQGKITQPFLGVRYIPVTKEIQQQNNLPVDYGALVLRGESMTDFAVVPGSPAAKAGIAENDIILEVNGTKIDQEHQLSALLSRFGAGDTVSLKILSKGQEKTVQTKLEERK